MPRSPRRSTRRNFAIVRRGSLKDYAAVQEIAAEVFSPYGDYGDVLPNYLFCEEDVFTWVVETEEGVVGFLQVVLAEREGFAGPVADIVAAGVAPGHQGLGYGTLLFQRAFELVRDLPPRLRPCAFVLTVADTNTRARALFERLGFSLTGRCLGRYEGGQMALEMVRPVS